jgi:hypothetical protein
MDNKIKYFALQLVRSVHFGNTGHLYACSSLKMLKLTEYDVADIHSELTGVFYFGPSCMLGHLLKNSPN